MSMQQMLLGATAAADKTYIENMFSLQAWPGTSHTVNPKSIVNGLDLATDGGLVWCKERGGGQSHVLFDTIRGATKALECHGSQPEETQTDGVTAFNTNGFTVGGGGKVNDTGKDYINWSWKKTPGFFDMVEWTGNGSNRTISHSLGCIPGMIIIKNRDSAIKWRVYHTGVDADSPENYGLIFSQEDARAESSTFFNDTKPTSTEFTIGTNSQVNSNGDDYIAYLFAGGESTAATARSVYFTGGQYLYTNTNNDFNFGTGDYCIECWCRFDDVASKYTAWTLGDTNTDGGMSFTAAYSTYRVNDGRTGDIILTKDIQTGGQWTHVAVTRESGTSRFFINGKLVDTSTDQSGDTIGSGTNNNKMTIGTQIENGSTGDHMKGNISNFRVVKGSAVYTTDFKVPTEPLTNITNTVLLCCNNSSITGSTVTPTTINESGGTAKIASPFDDPAAFIFGDGEDQNVIKTGAFLGGSGHPEIYLGWEPQWVLIKNADKASTNWVMLDSLRGMVTGGDDAYTTPDHSSPGESTADVIEVTPTGFKIVTTNDEFNEANDTMVFAAIRRPDGYCGKPAEAGTDVFAMDTGNSSSTIPCFDSNFAVDFALITKPDTTLSNYVAARLFSGKELITDGAGAEGAAGNNTFDSNAGWRKGGADSTFQSWMWKRHAGFDVVAVKPGAAGDQIPHNLGRVPEMIWAKDRGQSAEWSIYHKGLNGGTNPEQYRLKFTYDIEQDTTNAWNDTAPTATHFTTGSWMNNNNMLFMLFASISGISSIGSYTGSSSNVTVNCGFQPRFILIKENSATRQWVFFDTVRGIQSPGVDEQLYLSANYAQDDNQDYLDISSTGFTVKTNSTNVNQETQNYIYYAHA